MREKRGGRWRRLLERTIGNTCVVQSYFCFRNALFLPSCMLSRNPFQSSTWLKGEAKAAQERIPFLRRNVERGEAALADARRTAVDVKENMVLLRKRDPDLWGERVGSWWWCCCHWCWVVVGKTAVNSRGGTKGDARTA